MTIIYKIYYFNSEYFALIVTLLSPPLRWFCSAGRHGYWRRWPGCHCFSPPSPAGSPGRGGCGGHCRADYDDTAGVRGTHVVCLAQWSVLLPQFDDRSLPRVLLNLWIILLFILIFVHINYHLRDVQNCKEFVKAFDF